MTEVDEKIQKCLGEKRSFVLDAGAGSGKTYSLMLALRHVLAIEGDTLRRRAQKVACITYTNVAKDEIVERVAKRVFEGMGLIVLHSGHYSKIFKRLMGTPCSLKWREAGEKEIVWIVNPNHPIAAGLPECIRIEHEEMYGEPFSIPEPLETVMISHFEGGEVFRSGVTYRRGAGNIFYFRPGHEAYPTYHNADVLRVIKNATRWAYNPAKPWVGIHPAPNVPHDKAPYPFEVKGPRLHEDGEEGYR